MSRRHPAPAGGTTSTSPTMRDGFTFATDDWLHGALLALAAAAAEPSQAERYQRMAGDLTHQLDKGARGTAAHALLQVTVASAGRELVRHGSASAFDATRVATAWKGLKWEARW